MLWCRSGERRWRAARRAGLSEIPVVIRDLDDNQTLEIAIIENLQREDLTAIELAQGYQALIQQYDMTQEQVAAKLGKSRSAVANTVRLLALPKQVQEQVMTGVLSAGHAKALLSFEDPDRIIEVATRAIKEGLLVRDIEKLASEQKKGRAEPMDKVDKKKEIPSDGAWGDNYYKEMELALATELGRKVRIISHGKKSTIELDFYNVEELQDIAARLTKSHW